MGIVAEHQLGIESFENADNTRLKIEEDDLLMTSMEILHHGRYHFSGCEVGSKNVGAVDDNGQRGSTAGLEHHIPHELD